MRAALTRVVVGGAAAGAVALALGAGIGVEGRAATVAPPAFSGPIAATAPLGDASHDYPYSATVDDLTRYGYVEEEFFVEGTANRYTTPPGATGAVVDSGHPVRSPAALGGGGDAATECAADRDFVGRTAGRNHPR